MTVNLAPADLRKEGPAYDLPIAVGLLMASEQLQGDLSRTLIIGELSLDGMVRHTNGVLPMAALARDQKFGALFVPAADAPEAALVPGLDVYPIETGCCFPWENGYFFYRINALCLSIKDALAASARR